MDILPDVLKPDLKIVFCGMAAGVKSAGKKAYYAGPGNQFWRTLHEIGFTPYKYAPGEFPQLADSAIGLTDLVKASSGNDSVITPTANDAKLLRDKIKLFQPGILAFTEKGSARFFLGHKVDYGFQKEFIFNTRIFVLPSPAGSARKYWDVKFWHELARSLNR